MSEETFWNIKYAEGGISGLGSIGKYRRWKWKEIINMVGVITEKSFIDVGCGDMSFWEIPLAFWEMPLDVELRKCKEYLGIDISQNIIDINKISYPDRDFLCYNAKEFIYGISADVVLALDLLFHIMNEDDFETILLRLSEYSEDWIIIYNWINNPFAEEKKVSDGVSQYYRSLVIYDDVFYANKFEIKKVVKCPFDDYGALYFYRRYSYQ